MSFVVNNQEKYRATLGDSVSRLNSSWGVYQENRGRKVHHTNGGQVEANSTHKIETHRVINNKLFDN